MNRYHFLRFALMILMVITLDMHRITPAYADAPSNDDFDNATIITTFPFTDSIDTTEATKAPDDPICVEHSSQGNTGHTVWYVFTPPYDAHVIVNTFGSNFDTTLSAYTGSRGALSQIACNDDVGIDGPSQIEFEAVAGESYFLMGGAYPTVPGKNLVLNLEIAPPNDSLENAKVVSTIPFTDSISTIAATSGSEDLDCFGDFFFQSHTIWYVYSPMRNLRLAANTFGSDYDTTLTVYKILNGNLTVIACNDDSEQLQSRVEFDVLSKNTYVFMIGSFEDTPGGHLVFNLCQRKRGSPC